MPSQLEVAEMLKPLLLKDLRIQCRVRGINPGGSREALQERVRDHMMETGNYSLAAEFNGEVCISVPAADAGRDLTASDGAIGLVNNNYLRDAGQNVGNFITDRPSSRVLAPPGGVTSWSYGGDEPAEKIKAKPAATPQPAVQHPASVAAVAADEVCLSAAAAQGKGGAVELGDGHQNNYSRPQGQNVGNFITDKPSSRVLAPPGGGSSIVFG